MSETSEKPTEELQPILWLHVCEAGAYEFALAAFLTGSIANVPNLPEGDAEFFKSASGKMARIVMQEIGRRNYQIAMDQAEDTYRGMAMKARGIARDEGYS